MQRIFRIFLCCITIIFGSISEGQIIYEEYKIGYDNTNYNQSLTQSAKQIQRSEEAQRGVAIQKSRSLINNIFNQQEQNQDNYTENLGEGGGPGNPGPIPIDKNLYLLFPIIAILILKYRKRLTTK